MNIRNLKLLSLSLCLAALTACQPPQTSNTTVDVAPAPVANSNTTVANANTMTNAPAPVAENPNAEKDTPVTMPVIDAMFADETFAAELKSKLGLTDGQITKLKETARNSVKNLKENEDGSTASAAKNAQDEIAAVIGADKAAELKKLVQSRWTGDAEGAAKTGQANGVPTDTRIVVNAPAYRMDLFKDGKLVRTYKVGIGYPEFPLPTGMRKASQIIFNPTWTPPDEPWVEGSKTVKAGQKVEAGSALNPLGPIKIPIGLPSLIHGGKNPAKLGTFASHGCVGLTNPQVQDFSLALAQLSGTELSMEDVMNYEKAKTETKNVKLAQTIPVELRYETIVVEDGKLHIYRDVYEHGTNTEENLRKVLETYGVNYDSLTDAEKKQITTALGQMARDAQGNVAETNANTNQKSTTKNVTRTITGKKEVVIEIAALKGKGYPAPVDLNVGGKSKTALNLNPANANTNPAGSNTNSANANIMSAPKSSQSKKF